MLGRVQNAPIRCLVRYRRRDIIGLTLWEELAKTQQARSLWNRTYGSRWRMPEWIPCAYDSVLSRSRQMNTGRDSTCKRAVAKVSGLFRVTMLDIQTPSQGARVKEISPGWRQVRAVPPPCPRLETPQFWHSRAAAPIHYSFTKQHSVYLGQLSCLVILDSVKNKPSDMFVQITPGPWRGSVAAPSTHFCKHRSLLHLRSFAYPFQHGPREAVASSTPHKQNSQ